jgi:hypothetical protein
MPRHQGQPCSGLAAKRSRASARLRFIDQTGEYSTGDIGEYSSGGDSELFATEACLLAALSP